jgi:hypothetical protein
MSLMASERSSANLRRPNTSLELTPTVAPKNRFGRGVGFEPMIGSGGERSSARSRWAAILTVRLLITSEAFSES